MSRKVDPLELLDRILNQILDRILNQISDPILDQTRSSSHCLLLLLVKPTPTASFKTRLSVFRCPLHRCV